MDPPLLAVRGTEARMLSYEAGGTTIECEVMARAGERNVSGQLSGGVAAAVEAQVPGGPAAERPGQCARLVYRARAAVRPVPATLPDGGRRNYCDHLDVGIGGVCI